MAWIQLMIRCDANAETLISNALTSLGALAVTLQDAADTPIYEPDVGTTPLWGQIELVGLFPAECNAQALQQQLADICGEQAEFSCEVISLADKDWEREWLQHYQPMLFGDRLWVCPSDHTINDNAAIKLILDPGLAFGTGTHPTTALCLEWLATHDLKGCTVIDYGCGSGILAIAALKLGARHALAIDTDPQAITATHMNAERNAITETELLAQRPNQVDPLPCDVMIANILANPLISLADKLARLTKPNGHLILSGLLSEQVDAVMAAYAPHFSFAEPQYQEDWACLSARKHPQ